MILSKDIISNIFCVLFGLVLVLVSTSCSNDSYHGDLIEANPYLIGKWTGNGRFFDRDLNEEVGLVRIEFEIKEDYSIRGKFGEAHLVRTGISNAKYGFAIKGELDSKLNEGFSLDKDHLVILFVVPDKSDKDVSTSDANFHLKSNYVFDFSMRVGGVQLTKEL